MSSGMLRYGSGLFADSGFGCFGAIIVVLLMSGAMFGLVAMVWGSLSGAE
jgi:hypothetical protein